FTSSRPPRVLHPFPTRRSSDLTAGKETYPAGRFLYSAMPRDGEVVLDFNKAYSPPCAFTDYATCPLPPPQNRLPVRVEAGEKDRSEEHTSELQSRSDLVCRLLL